MARSLGNKRKEIHADAIKLVTEIYSEFEEGPFCKIYPNDFFGYRRITVERPEKDDKGNPMKDKTGNLKADTALRDYENVPLLREVDGKLMPQTVEEYFEREVKPHVPDAWLDTNKRDEIDGQVGIKGYEINFTRYFYEYKPLRGLEDIRKEIVELELHMEKKLSEVLK
jgi:type I restriction enzyme M protein